MHFTVFVDTTQLQKMHLVSILRKHIVNSEKPMEVNIEKKTTEIDDVEVNDVIMQTNNVMIPDSSNCDNVSPNTTMIDQVEDNATKIQQLETQLRKKNKVIKIIKTKHKAHTKQLQSKLRRLQNTVCKTNSLVESTSKLFNDDQVQLLTNEKKKVSKWCSDTLVKSYKLKFACGISGYTELLKQGHPLPSLRTLTRRLEKLQFRSGLIEDIFYFLRIKVSQFEKETDKDCMLVLRRNEYYCWKYI